MKPTFQCFGGEEERGDFAHVYTFSGAGWLHCIHDTVVISSEELKTREVVKDVGFQSRDLKWYSRVQSGFCGLPVTTQSLHHQAPKSPF